ncbi:MAG: EAL domain-containing protein [Pseudohongiellaceae bacterium]
MLRKPNMAVLKVVGIYTVLSVLWILYSDSLLALFVDQPEQMTLLQSVKGVGFVSATAALLYLLIVRMESHLLEAHNALKLNSRVLSNIREGVMVTDADNRIVMVNRAFERITGHRQQEVLGQNPSMLSSGRQPAAFYRSLWARLLEEDHWQGEILNRRKSGDIFPERLSISTIRGRNGDVEHYVAIFSDATEEKEAQERIDFLAHYDPLTGLPNRETFKQRIEETIHPASRTDILFTVLSLDLDRFKLINEGMGYAVGDGLLREIAQRLLSVVGESDVVARQSGDEFLILLLHRDIQQTTLFAEKIMETVSQPFTSDGQELSFTCSIGMARYPEDGQDAATLIQAANSALSLTKRSGRNGYRFHDAGNQSRSLESMQLEHGLRHAAARGELLLHYQPQHGARDGRLVGAEALLRWQHPELGLLSPGHFIAIAEETGQINEIGSWLLEEVIRQLHDWLAAGLQPVPVAINLSVNQFRFPSLVQDVRSILQAREVPPFLLCLEITESAAMADAEYTLATIAELQQLGVSLAIDDFGSGYSSFTYLRQLHVEKLKIDQGFIRQLPSDARDHAIVQSIITLAHSLGFITIAEGVETAAQLETLREMGCDEIQGYLFARPMPAAEFETLLSDRVPGPE